MSGLQTRPLSVQQDFDAVLGEVLSDLWRAGRLGGAARSAALSQALGPEAMRRALTGRLEERGAGAKVALRAGGVAVASAARRLVPRSPLGMLIAAAAGAASWLVAAPRVTPHRRVFAERIFAARRAWEHDRAAWLDGRMTRDAREAAIEGLIAQLVEALGAAPVLASPGPDGAPDGDAG